MKKEKAKKPKVIVIAVKDVDGKIQIIECKSLEEATAQAEMLRGFGLEVIIGWGE